jgi:hypothetical protein
MTANSALYLTELPRRVKEGTASIPVDGEPSPAKWRLTK